MSDLHVGVRELKSRLSEYLRQVRDGQSVVVTDHGRPVARLVPAGESIEVRLHLLAEAGLLQWSGARLSPQRPLAQVRGTSGVADLLVEQRP
jgi:prevent-host-death family protein